MPLRNRHSTIVRFVIGTRGQLAMHTELILRFGYGAIVPWVTRLETGALRAIAGPDMVVLHTPVHVRGKDMTTVGEFTISRGETIPFVLTYSPSHLPLPEPVDATAALRRDRNVLARMDGKMPAGRTLVGGRPALGDHAQGAHLRADRRHGRRSDHLAAGAARRQRNWDYRFCWLRDATLTLLGAMHAGYFEEAQAWREWLLRAVAGSPHQLQIMYGLGGERRLTEWTATWLPGYENSAPVRIGNAAHTQLQLDVFGEIMDVHHQARRCGLSTNEFGMGRAARVPRSSQKNLAGARSGHLGNARAAPAFHLFQGHGLGRLRSRDQKCGDVRSRRAAR